MEAVCQAVLQRLLKGFSAPVINRPNHTTTTRCWVLTLPD